MTIEAPYTLLTGTILSSDSDTPAGLAQLVAETGPRCVYYASPEGGVVVQPHSVTATTNAAGRIASTSGEEGLRLIAPGPGVFPEGAWYYRITLYVVEETILDCNVVFPQGVEVDIADLLAEFKEWRKANPEGNGDGDWRDPSPKPDTPTFLITANGDGTYSVASEGFTDNGDGTITLSDAAVLSTDEANGTIDVAVAGD